MKKIHCIQDYGASNNYVRLIVTYAVVIYIVTQTPSFRQSRDLDKSNTFIQRAFHRPLSRRLDRCDRVIQNESRDPFGGNVYYVTMQITFLTRKFRNGERNLHCDVVHITTKWVFRLTLDCNGVFAIKAHRPLSRRLDRCNRVFENESRDPFGGNVYYVTMQITFFTRKFWNGERNVHCDIVHITTKWVSSLTLDCNGVFAIKAYCVQYVHCEIFGFFRFLNMLAKKLAPRTVNT